MENKAIIVAALVVLVIVVLAFVPWLVMVLWNLLLPSLFGFKTIGYWQAMGLYVMFNLFFNGLNYKTK